MKKKSYWHIVLDERHFVDGLNMQEIFLLAYIANFRRNGMLCFVSNKRLAEVMKTSESSVKRMLQNLEQNGLISRDTKKHRNGSDRLIEVNDPVSRDYENQLSDFSKQEKQHGSKMSYPRLKNELPHGPEMSRAVYKEESIKNIYSESEDSVCADCVELSNLPEQSEVTNKQSNQPEQIGALEEKQSARETTEQSSEQICFDISNDVPTKNTILRRPAPVNPVNLQRILKMFRVRNPNRKLSAAEKRAWDKIKSDITEEEVAILEKFYAHERSDNYTPLWNRKTQPQTLMNNWHSQVDLAYRWTEEQTPRKELGIVDPNRKLVASKDWRKGARQYVTEMREGPQRDGIIALLRKNDQELTQVDYQTIATFIKEGDW